MGRRQDAVRLAALAFAALWISSCSTTRFVPDATQIQGPAIAAVSFSGPVALVNGQRGRRFKRTERNFSVRHYVTDYRNAARTFISALGREIEKRGGRIDAGADRRIAIRIERIDFDLPSPNTLTIHSMGTVDLLVSLGDQPEFSVHGHCRKAFVPGGTGHRLEYILNRTLQDGLDRLLQRTDLQAYLR
jgi:hypothetical protein